MPSRMHYSTNVGIEKKEDENEKKTKASILEGSEKIDRVREVQGAAGRKKPDAVCGVKSNRYSEYLPCRLEKRQKQAKV